MAKLTAMRTAKELAWKAYCDSLKLAVYKIYKNKGEELYNIDLSDVFNVFNISAIELKERFELWWSEYYTRGEHKDGFNAEHFVMMDSKVYIQAE